MSLISACWHNPKNINLTVTTIYWIFFFNSRRVNSFCGICLFLHFCKKWDICTGGRGDYYCGNLKYHRFFDAPETGHYLHESQFSVWRLISEVFRIALFYQPQDVVVMKFSWCEDHGWWYHQTVKMVIISMYRHYDNIGFSHTISLCDLPDII